MRYEAELAYSTHIHRMGAAQRISSAKLLVLLHAILSRGSARKTVATIYTLLALQYERMIVERLPKTPR